MSAPVALKTATAAAEPRTALANLKVPFPNAARRREGLDAATIERIHAASVDDRGEACPSILPPEAVLNWSEEDVRLFFLTDGVVVPSDAADEDDDDEHKPFVVGAPTRPSPRAVAERLLGLARGHGSTAALDELTRELDAFCAGGRPEAAGRACVALASALGAAGEQAPEHLVRADQMGEVAAAAAALEGTTRDPAAGPATGAPPSELDVRALIGVELAKKFSGYGWDDGRVVDVSPDGRMAVRWTSRETERPDDDESMTFMRPAEIVRAAVAREESAALEPWLRAFSSSEECVAAAAAEPRQMDSDADGGEETEATAANVRACDQYLFEIEASDQAKVKRRLRAQGGALRVAPNALVEVAVVENSACSSGLVGQLGARARRDLRKNLLIPLAGRVGTDGRDGYCFNLNDEGTRVLDPDPRCAATYVNDAFGPRRDSASKRALRASMNVSFVLLHDRDGLPHVFWRTQKPIRRGEWLLGDYGDAFWSSKSALSAAAIDDTDLSALMRRVLFSLRGRGAACAIEIGDEDEDEDAIGGGNATVAAVAAPAAQAERALSRGGDEERPPPLHAARQVARRLELEVSQLTLLASPMLDLTHSKSVVMDLVRALGRPGRRGSAERQKLELCYCAFTHFWQDGAADFPAIAKQAPESVVSPLPNAAEISRPSAAHIARCADALLSEDSAALSSLLIITQDERDAHVTPHHRMIMECLVSESLETGFASSCDVRVVTDERSALNGEKELVANASIRAGSEGP